MNEYDIQANWIRPSTTLPPSGTRCIVTDGDIILIGTFIAHGNEQSVWVFSGLNDSNPFVVKGWMPLPKPMKKFVSYETQKPAENKIEND